MFKRTIISLLAIAGLVVGSLGAVYFNSPATDALSMKNFDAGNIISDAVFYDSNSMSASQIQTFLNNKVPNCDTNGSLPYRNTGKSVKQYWTPRGEPVPYTCLKDWKQKTPSVTGESGICSYMKGYSSRTAAQIISDVAKACGISPKVLLVLLQKEQSLVTDTSPLRNLQYGSATGMGCPDTAGCDPAYDGFFNQVYGAARQYKLYRAAPGNYNYVAGRTNYIQYHPNASCGGSKVYIKNQATAGLYNYTPYQPNEATKNVPYGHTAHCGAYGNKNFWYLFTSWFGSTQGGEPVAYDITMTSPIKVITNADGKSTVSFKVKNFSGTRVEFDKTIIQCRDYQNKNCDSDLGGGWYLNPGQERTFSYPVDMSSANTYVIKPYVSMYGIWHRYNTSQGIANHTTVQNPDIKITSDIKLSPKYLAPRSESGVSFGLKNTGNSPIKISKTVVQCRYNGKNCDSNYGGPTTVGVNETRTFTYKFTSMDGGNHTLIPYFMVDGKWFTYNESGDNKHTRIVNVADLSLSGDGVTLSDPNPIPGQTVTANYTIKNEGTAPVTPSRSILQCRLNDRTNCDPQYVYDGTIAAGAEKTYTTQLKIPASGSYKLTPYFEHMNTWLNPTTSGSTSSLLVLEVSKYKADMRLTSDISVTPSNANPGDTLTATYTVRNFGDKPAYYQRSILQCRLDSRINCDTAYNDPNIVIAPGESRTFSNKFDNIQPGTYRFTPYFEQDNTWRLYDKGTATANTYSKLINPITITSPITFKQVNGSESIVSLKVKNLSDTKVSFDRTVVQCRDTLGRNCDSNYGDGWYLNPGQERTFSYTIDVSKKDTYKIIPYYYRDGTWHTYGGADSIPTTRTLIVN